MGGNTQTSQSGRQGSAGNTASGERAENGERTADSAGSIEAESTTDGETVHQPQPERKGLEQTSDVGRKGDSTGVADEARQARIEQFDADRTAEREQTRQAEQATEAVTEETAVPVEETPTEPQASALERVPVDEQGNPIYEAVDAETAWDAIVEQTQGDVAMAQTVADSMVADKKAALDKVKKAKSKGGNTIAEKIAAEQERKNAIIQAETELAQWEAIAGTNKRRAEEAEAIAKAEAEAVRQQKEAEQQAKAEDQNYDNQGNPIDAEGNLIVEEVTSIDEITDEDFTNPTRSIQLPQLPNNVSDAIGANGRRVVIKKNVFGKNLKSHKDLTPEDSRKIITTALYTPNLYGQNQKQNRPYNWILIHLADKNTCVLVEVNHGKDNIEVINWHYIGESQLKQKERQAEREGGRILTLSENNAVGNTSHGLSSNSKDTTSSQNNNELEAENVQTTIGEQVQAAEAEVNTAPTDKQKEAGNYKKGHVQIGTFNVTIEQPRGSVRSGVDKGGKKWEVEMKNTYGYIRGTEGVDGDHIDVFLADDIDSWDGSKVFVVDQYNEDGTFDEHKVMLGFNDINEAEEDYLSNYEQGWQGLGAITGVSIEDFEKWIASSHRKTKAFAEYKSVKTTAEAVEAENVQSAEAQEEARRKPLRERISQWSKKTGVKVNFIEKFEDVKHKAPKEAIAEGKIVDGWFDKETGEVYFYMPHLSDAKNADLTFVHEVVAHKGMEALLGKKGYDALCDAVWNSMSEKARKTFENYPGVSNIKNPIKRRRAAADEYIAHLAEKTDLTKAEKLIWSKIVDFIREALEALGMHMKVSDAELSMLIRAAYAKMVQEAKKNANVAEESEVKVEAEKAQDEKTEKSHQFEIYNRELSAIQERHNTRKRPPMPGKLIEAYSTNDQSAIEDWEQRWSDYLQGLVVMDMPEIESTIRNIKKQGRVRGADGKINKQSPIYKAHNYIANTLMKRATALKKEATEEELEAIDIVNKVWKGDIRFSAKRKSRATEIDEANFHQTKQEVNREIDIATGLFIPGGAKRARAIRQQKERERKALATEIYSKVLAGDFNPLTLQQIEKYINDVTPRNPFGRRISQRVPQKVERSVYGGKSKGAVDLLFSRICESSVAASRRNSEEGRRAIEERKKEALKGWAIATDNWHTDLSEFTNDKEPFAQGTDSKVYISKDGGYVIKASKGKPYGKRFRADIDNVALFNHIFPNSKYEILGYGEIDGDFVRILRQPFVDFAEDAYLSEDERVAYMAELDFKPLNKENTAFSNGDFVAADLQKANIVRDSKGNIRVIDADMKLHTTDIGGNYSYAPVEDDVLSDNEVNSRVHSAEEGDIRFKVANESQEIFVSNAQKAVEGIKQDKATPQQWLAMIQKQGGLKAGEDRWMGLSEWLQGSEAKTLTKQEVLDFIEANKIEIEEVNYGESEVSQFEDSDIYNEWAELGGDEDAFNEMIERYGDDFEMAFLYDEGQLYVADEDAASFFIDKGAETINETRLSYTTEGLTDNREIALTVPTIEPYNQNDDIHFGDAGGGRAVAWVRFGDTKDANGNDVLVIDEIQSVRHQDGREKGYRNEEVIALENRINSLHEKMYGEGLAPEEYRELTRLREEQREIIINANPELKAESEKVKELEKEYEALKKDNQSKLDPEGVELARLQTLQNDARSIAEYDRIEKEIQDIKDAADKRKAELNEFFNVTIGNAYDKLHKGIRNDLSNQVYGVPVAPFEKNWHELAMKRMLRYAAENGYDKVAWTTGAQQAARYDMRQQVDNIQVEENNIEEFNDGTPIAKNITINTPRGNKIRYQADAEGNIRGGEYGGKNLKDVVGKELAEKIMQPGSFTIEEEGLAIGGEGMKGFYDKMLPSFVQKYTKKWGAKVGTVELPDLEEGSQQMWSVDVTDSMKDDVMEGQVMFRAREANERFNKELQQQIDGTLPVGHIYQLGMPGEILRSTGIPALPIQLNSTKLEDKSKNYGHDYSLEDIKDLVLAMQNPLAIFAYGNKEKAQNVVIEIQSNGKNFVVGLALRPLVGGRVLEVNSVRNVFPKDNAEWLNWIAQDKSLYLDKKRIQTLINQQRTNLADVEYLDLNSIANIIETFANPQISEGENSGEQENLTSEDSNTRMKVEDQWQDLLTEKEREAMQAEHDAVDEGGFRGTFALEWREWR